jgi:hypothetical protein
MQTGKSYNYELWSTCKKWDPWNNIDSSVKMLWTYFYKLQNKAALTYYAWIGSFLSSDFDFMLAWIGDFLGPSMCCFTKTLVFQKWANSLLSFMLSSFAFFQYVAWAYWASPPHLLHLFTQFSRAMQQLFSLFVWPHVLRTFVEALWCLHPKLAFWTTSSNRRAAIVMLLHVFELRPIHSAFWQQHHHPLNKNTNTTNS